MKLWEFGAGENGVRGPLYTQINQHGRVPALEDTNIAVVAWESGAISSYIVRVYDRGNCFGPGATEQERIDYDKWTVFLVSGLSPLMSQLKYARKEQSTEWIARRESLIREHLDILEGQLAKTDGFILPQGLSAVGMHFFPWLAIADTAGALVEVSLEEYAAITRGRHVMEEMETVKRGFRAVQEGKKA